MLMLILRTRRLIVEGMTTDMDETATKMSIRLIAILAIIHQANGHHQIQRPFYIFGHMANSLSEVDAFLSAGVNALEADVQFSVTGRPYVVFHGIPCDCLRRCLGSTSFTTYLTYIRDIGCSDSPRYNSKMSLLYLDLKLSSVLKSNYGLAGQYLASYLFHYFYQSETTKNKIRIILGFENSRYENVLASFQKFFHPTLEKKIGYDVGVKQEFWQIRQMYQRLNLTERSWQGDGATNCFLHGDDRIRQIIKLRDLHHDYVNKAYVWTIDWKRTIRNALRLGVDGIMSNRVDNVVDVLREKEFASKYRLATNRDNPWTNVKGHGPIRTSCAQDTCWKDCNFDGDWCWTKVNSCSNNYSKCNSSIPCHGTCSRYIVDVQSVGKKIVGLFIFNRN